ncbi:MAG: hypothetical protein ACI8W7_001882 [Gammaproteobacteria bacterium]
MIAGGAYEGGDRDTFIHQTIEDYEQSYANAVAAVALALRIA